MITSILISSEMAVAAISMSSASSSNAHHSSPPSRRWTSSTCRKSWPDWYWAVARATAAPQRTPCPATSRTWRGMSRRRAATVLPVGTYQHHQRWRPQTPIWGGSISWTTNKSASARNTAVFYPGVYWGVIYISVGKAVSERIYRLVGELYLDWISSCINRGKIITW